MNKSLQKRINHLIVFLTLLGFVLGYYGWHSYHAMYEMDFTFTTGMFLSLQLFTINSSFEHIVLPLSLNIARFLAPFSLASAILNAFFMLFYRTLLRLQIRYRYRGHYIFNGLNFHSLRLIRDLLKDPACKVVVLEKDEKNPAIAQAMHSRVRILHHNPASAQGLKQAGIHKASYFIAMQEQDMDNMAFVARIIGLSQGVHTQHALLKLNDPDHLALFTDFESDHVKLDIHAFNYERKCAAFVMDAYSPDRFFPVMPGYEHAVQVMIAGFEEAATHLLIEGVLMYHFANLKKTHFILTDTRIKEKYQAFLLRHPMIEHAADITCIEYEDCLKGTTAVDFSALSVVFVCGHNDARTTHMALQIRQLAFGGTQVLSRPAIVAIHRQSKLLSSLVSGIAHVFEHSQIHLVNYLSYFNRTTFIEDKQVYDNLAKYIDAYYAETYEGKQLTEQQVEERWMLLSDRAKESNRLPARHYHYKLRVLGAKMVKRDEAQGEELRAEDVDALTYRLLARMEKNRWNAEKYVQGFVPGQYLADKKQEKLLKNNLKVHPALKGWDEISEEEREKDSTVIRHITAILDRAGLKVVKNNP